MPAPRRRFGVNGGPLGRPRRPAYVRKYGSMAEMMAEDAAKRQAENEAVLRASLEDPNHFVSNMLNRSLWHKQQEIIKAVWKHPRVAVQSCHASGKLAGISEPVLTPSGWSTMGAMRPGSKVMGRDGKPSTVLQVHPQGIKPLYRVTLDDGTWTLCGLEHLWFTTTRADKRAKPKREGSVKTTEDIMRTLRFPNGAREGRNHVLPRVEPVQHPPADLPLDPYVLGVWLGDGTVGQGAYTKPDPAVRDCVEDCGHEVHQSEVSHRHGVVGLKSILRDLRIIHLHSHERFVPEAYMHASIEQRRALLAGILDTDGSCSQDGHVDFSSSSERLADAVCELVRSLGGVARRGMKEEPRYQGGIGRPAHLVWIAMPENPFRAETKASLWRRPQDRWLDRYIDTIEYSHDEDAVCISIDNDDMLYLARHHIPTHNSFLAATTAVAFLNVYPDSIVVTTAPTFRQVEKVMWAEIRSCYASAHITLAGRVLGTEIKIDDKWFAMGVATNDPNRLQGLHSISGSILVIMDEASGFDAEMWEAIEAILTGTNARLLMIGNPTDPSSQFARECTMLPPEAHFTISAYDTPNLNLAPGQKPIPGLITQDWVDDKKRRWGETSPMYVSRVLGRFPSIGTDTLIPLGWIEAAQQRWMQMDALKERCEKERKPNPEVIDERAIGVDIARFGDDETVIAKREGIRVWIDSAHSGLDTVAVALAAKQAAEELARPGEAPVQVKLDVIGVGAGAVDYLRNLKRADAFDHDIHAMNVSMAATDNEQYMLMRSEWAWALRERFAEGRIALDPNDTDTAAELASVKYRYSAGRIQLEPKDDMKKRLGHSPDRFDAVMLACAKPLTPISPITEAVAIAMPIFA